MLFCWLSSSFRDPLCSILITECAYCAKSPRYALQIPNAPAIDESRLLELPPAGPVAAPPRSQSRTAVVENAVEGDSCTTLLRTAAPTIAMTIATRHAATNVRMVYLLGVPACVNTPATTACHQVGNSGSGSCWPLLARVTRTVRVPTSGQASRRQQQVRPWA